MTQIKAWSYTAIAQWELCPAQYKYERIDKLPRPKSPALDRGIRIDKLAEDYVNGAGSDAVPSELSKFSALFKELRAIAPENKVVQQQWGFTQDWRPSGWSDWKKTWLRVKLDAAAVYPDGTADVIDFKTGKKYESNKEQLQLYAPATFRRYPHLSNITARLWYLDSGEEEVATFQQHETTDLIRAWEQRVAPMFADTTFVPRPNDKCHWCSFSKSKAGPCRFG